ncbi:MAG: LysM peptidoglycan-binding domain-containing protein [Erysipelotrichales bacterium]|nr:LysM peptidoglycan-binding domain-containing protein [Erysipelotrichales bacterium]
MKKIINYEKEISIEDNVASITSISLECSYNENRNNVDGIFLIEGSYKTHELSLNKKDFRYELPFNNEIEDFKKESAHVEIEDFTYELEDNILKINIDYELSYDEEEVNEEIQEEFNEDEFERFLNEHEVDIVSFKDEEETEDAEEGIEVEDRDEQEQTIEEIEDNLEDNRTITLEPQESNDSVEETLLNNISKEEKYITYHVYVCENDDTIESISKKYNITKEEIFDYNSEEEIRSGVKLIIPVKDE